VSRLDDFIEFSNPNVWDFAFSQSRTAVKPTPNVYYPIEAFDLGVNLFAAYTLVVVESASARATWKYAGELRQAWNFAKGGEIGEQLSLAQSEPKQLFLKRVQLIGLNPNTIEPYRLIYLPPYWFQDVSVYGWQYTGAIENFVIDTLFDIGNKVGAGTLNEPDNIPNLINELKQKIDNLPGGSSGESDSNTNNNTNEGDFY
jgi:hypothetical protein